MNLLGFTKGEVVGFADVEELGYFSLMNSFEFLVLEDTPSLVKAL